VTADSELIARLRADLTKARFSVDRLDALWGSAAEAALGRGNRVPAERALAGNDDPAATLARLFVLGEAVSCAAADTALPALGVPGAVDLALVAIAGEVVRPLVDLRPYGYLDTRGTGEWWIASDLGELATGRELRVDHVLGVGGASVTLSGLQLPDPVESALDLGTGCGIQALHARRWARRVVATDISERALGFARLNAELNGVDGIEFRLGSMFEPVAGERFDRIVSNPPFVITPRDPNVPAYEYRDGGLEGDALVESFVAGARDHLVPGGVAQLLGNWEYRAPGAGAGAADAGDGLERAAGWADAAGLETWIIEREQLDAASYAETWIRDGGTKSGSPEFERLCRAWLDDFDRRGVTAVGFGYLLLRDPRGALTLRRTERLDAPIAAAAAALGAHFSAVLAAHDRVAQLTDLEVLATRFAVAGDVTEERSHWPGEQDPTVIVLRQGGALHRELRVGTELAAVVGACDGELILGAIVAAVAELLEIDGLELAESTVIQARELVIDGILILPT
jgi:methylase of polypeptide subunit release factors